MPERPVLPTSVANLDRDLGVAGPPPAPAGEGQVPIAETQTASLPANGVGEHWFDYGWCSGWVGSLCLHAMLLLCLACWYFTAPRRTQVEIDSQLAGSLHGHPDGDQATGGSNGTPISLASELGDLQASESTTKLEQPDQSVTTQNDVPEVKLTPPRPLEEEGPPVPASRQSRSMRGRPIGIGDAGNWVLATATGLGWRDSGPAAK